jgi:hypothetical protein
VTDRALHGRTKFAERPVILDYFEEGIVPEAVRAGRLEADPATANIMTFGAYISRRIGQRDMARVTGGAPFQWCVAEPFQQPRIVLFIAGIRAGKSSGKNAWRTTQRVHLQPAVVGQHPLAQMARLLSRFQYRIGRERIAILDNLDGVWKVVESRGDQTQWRDELAQFIAFFAIMRAND